eukprot:6096568-Pyramimonas_sp.AAC.3
MCHARRRTGPAGVTFVLRSTAGLPRWPYACVTLRRGTPAGCEVRGRGGGGRGEGGAGGGGGVFERAGKVHPPGGPPSLRRVTGAANTQHDLVSK